MTGYTTRKQISDYDFLVFGIVLTNHLQVTKKTLKRYIMEAWKAANLAGVAPTHPKSTSLLSLLGSLEDSNRSKQRLKLDYCGIK